MALGCALCAVSFVVMLGGAKEVESGRKANVSAIAVIFFFPLLWISSECFFAFLYNEHMN
jgi:hypothetical protein